LAYMQKKGFITDGTTIADRISPELYKAYAEQCKSLGIPPANYNYYQPWMAVLVLQSLMASDKDESQPQANAALGIDFNFLVRAIAYQKNIIELESLEFQIDLLSTFSAELQEQQLASLLLTPENDADVSPEKKAQAAYKSHQALVEIVKNGDDKALEEVLGYANADDNPFSKEYNEKMVLKRNISMVEKIKGFLTDDVERGGYFVVIGAGHMVGKDGIVEMLTKEGFVVERIK